MKEDNGEIYEDERIQEILAENDALKKENSILKGKLEGWEETHRSLTTALLKYETGEIINHFKDLSKKQLIVGMPQEEFENHVKRYKNALKQIKDIEADNDDVALQACRDIAKEALGDEK